MQIKIILFSVILLTLFSCKSNNKTDVIQEESINDNICDTLKTNVIQTPPTCKILDTIPIKMFNLLILKIEGYFQFDSKDYYPSTYLTLLKKDFSVASVFDNIVAIYPIGRHNIEKEHFFDISNKVPIDGRVVLKYSYCGGGAADLSDNHILTVSDTSIEELFFVSHWDYYYNDLDFKRVNDTIVRLTYTSRDKFGHFHNDYIIDIDIQNIQTHKLDPLAQGFYFSSTSSDNITLYKSIDEASRKIANTDSLIIKSGIGFQFDSVYWDKEVFKITVPDFGSGYVNFDDSGIEIPINAAG